jgi:hypothetical protein
MPTSNNIKPGILIDATVWQNFKDKVPKNRASDTLENFMVSYPGPTENETSVIQVNKEIWQNFKDKYQDIAIQEVERLMQLAVSSPSNGTNVMSVNTAFVNSVSIPAASNWNVNYANNSINLTQIGNANATTTITTTGSTASYNISGSAATSSYTIAATTTTPNILIDFNGDNSK